MSTPETFDEYCDRLDIKTGEEPMAFAAYLNQQTGWDGDMHEVEPNKEGTS